MTFRWDEWSQLATDKENAREGTAVEARRGITSSRRVVPCELTGLQWGNGTQQEVNLHYGHEGVWRSGGIPPPISMTVSDGASGQLHAPVALTPGKTTTK
jgi:hypothetical protein